jgi:hypothetical protein
MAKQVQMIVEIDENGELHVEAEGTTGNECVDLLKFLDYIQGFEVVESRRTDDGNSQKVVTTNKQKLHKQG